MANNGTLKMKMLALWEILQQESDIANPLIRASWRSYTGAVATILYKALR